MGDELDAIRRPFGPADLQPLLKEASIDCAVVVQTVSSLDETRELLAIAAANRFIAGVVGWVDLTDRNVTAALTALRASGPGGEKLVGIRHPVHDEADAEWLLRDDVQRGIAAVSEAGLVFDLLVRTRELPAALETARRHPHMQFVINHAAKPRIALGPRDRPWEDEMKHFAGLTNVACKLSGLFTEADLEKWTPAEVAPYVKRVVEWFGPERCMFGSDWPMCLLTAKYSQVVESIQSVVKDDARVFGGTATRLYWLS